MSKLLVETCGPHILLHPTGIVVHHNRPTVIPAGSWAPYQMAQGNLTVLHPLPDEASDVEWSLWLRECGGDIPLAIASYLAKFTAEAEESGSQNKKARHHRA